MKRTRSSSGAHRNARPRATSLYYFDRAAADLACDFFPRFLVHTKGEWAGQPFELAEWQKQEIIRPLFGWKRRSDGLRRYRIFYGEFPRKNGKSELAAGMANMLLTADKEPGAEVYSAAADRHQAGIVFRVAANMVKASAQLSQIVDCFRYHLFVPSTLSIYQVLSADVPTKEGLNPHGIIFDEFHVQADRLLWDVLRTGRGSRRQPLIVVITTAGTDKKSLCGEMHDRAIAVRDGIEKDDAILPVVYGIQKGEDWKDREVWKRCNPNYGISVKPSYLEEEFQEAIQSPAYENTFRRYYLDEWVTQVVRWINMAKWDACSGELSFRDLEDSLEGKACIAGLDLSTTTDLSALVLTFKHLIEPGQPGYPTEDSLFGGNRKLVIPGFEYGDPYPIYDLLPYFWCPEENIELRAKRDKAPYDLWQKDGFLNATEGDAIDHKAIRLAINEKAKRFFIQEIAADPYNAHQLLMELDAEDGFVVSKIRQGFLSLSAPTKELDTLYLRRRIRHAAHPVLRWCANNASLEKDAADNWKPSKKKSSERIDGISALVTALARQIVTQEVDQNRGLSTIG